MTHMGNMGGGYQPPFTKRDKILLVTYAVAVVGSIGFGVWLIFW
jgi:hypothetical protein